MDTIFMTTENSATNEPHRFRINLRDKINLKVPHRHLALSSASLYYTWKNVTKAAGNGKFKIKTGTWEEEFELPEGSYSVADVNGYFQYIIKKHTTDTDLLSVFVNRILNRVAFKMKSGVSLELMNDATKRFLGSSKSVITGEINGDLVPKVETVQTVLIHCNLVNNDYQHDSRVLYAFVPDKSFGQLLSTSPSDFIWLKTFKSEFSYIEVWFTDQNSKPLEIEDSVAVTMVIR